MAITDLVLNTDKSSSDINNDKITVRQSERGLVLNATIKAKDGTNYDLSGKTVQFAENKDGEKLVLDENVQVDSSKQGVIHYTLNREVYSASGTAWFEIITNSGEVIDTTQNFYINVLKDAEINVANDNYISSLNGLIAHVKVAGDKAQETINDLVKQLTDDVNSKKQEADNISADLTKKFDDKMTDLNNQLSDYQSKYNKLSTDWANELKTISDQATSDINAKYAQKLVDLQNDYNSWKSKTVADFNATVDPIKKSIEQNATDVASVKKLVQDTVAQMNVLKQDFDKVDFTKFVTGDQIKNYYTKTDVNNLVSDLRAKIATAGAVKTVDGNSPDSNGNVVSKAVIYCDSPQAAYDASTTDKFHLYAYDMNNEATEGYVAGQRVTIETLHNDIQTLQSQMSSKANTSDLANLGKVKTVNGTQPDSNGNVNVPAPDLSGYATKSDLATAGKMKTISVNGGAKVAPDASGNANITIPAPDLSSKADKSDLQSLANRVTAIENKPEWTKANSKDDAVSKSANGGQYYW